MTTELEKINILRELLEAYIILVGNIEVQLRVHSNRYGLQSNIQGILEEIRLISAMTNKAFTPENIGGNNA